MGEGGPNSAEFEDDGVKAALLAPSSSETHHPTVKMHSPNDAPEVHETSSTEALLPAKQDSTCDCVECGAIKSAELIDPCVIVNIDTDNLPVSPDDCDSLPPMYHTIDAHPSGSSTQLANSCAPPQQQQYSAAIVNDNLLYPTAAAGGTAAHGSASEYALPLHLQDITASESCSLVLPSILDSKSSLSDSASVIIPFCRICHMAGDDTEILITPCRCAGTLQFIHDKCLQVRDVREMGGLCGCPLTLNEIWVFLQCP